MRNSHSLGGIDGQKEFTVSEVIDSIGISSHTWVVFVLLAFAMIF